MNKSLATNLLAAAVAAAGFFSPVYGDQLRTVGFFALSGAVTNWVAIHMLFEKVPLLYGSGVVPNHFEDFKRGIRNLIMNQFFTEENMRKFLADTAGDTSLTIDGEAVADAVEYDKAFDALTAVIIESSLGGMLNMFGGPAVLQGFRVPFEQRMHEFIRTQVEDEKIQQAIRGAASGSDEELIHSVKKQVDRIVEARLDELTPKMVKEIVQEMIARHLGWLVVWGGVFGGIIGLGMSLVNLM